MRFGFTLIEMSIVLVIAGLLIGAVTAGRELIHAADVRKQIDQVRQIEVSLTAFKDKYEYYPGDMPNATSFWGTTDPSGNTISNGDGNTIIMSNGFQNAGNDCIQSYPDARHGTGTVFEGVYLWRHLHLAGLSDYNPHPTSGDQWLPLHLSPTFHIMVGCTLTNNPTSNAFIPANRRYAGPVTIFPWDIQFPGAAQPTGQLGTATPAGGIQQHDAWLIDTKLDDGSPTTGRLWVIGGCARNAATYMGTACGAYPYSALAKVM